MLCQHCKKNEATVSYVEIINGKKSEFHLCNGCYANLYDDLGTKVNGDILAGFFGSSQSRVKVCPVCRTTYADYERTGLLGCTSCYDVFKEELMNSIERLQNGATHVGKVPDNVDEFGLHRKLKSLQEELESALRDKRFKDAGRLNREINTVKKKIAGGEGDE